MTRQERGRTEAPEKNTKRTPKVLVGVRVPQQFHDLLLLECRRRQMTLQQLITSALRQYFKAPTEPPVDREYEILTVVHTPCPDAGLIRLWQDYVEKMPWSRTVLLAGTMMQDLVFINKTTRKTTKKQKSLLRAYSHALTSASASSSQPFWIDPDFLAANYISYRPGNREVKPASREHRKRETG
jgi:hypothetical protein